MDVDELFDRDAVVKQLLALRRRLLADQPMVCASLNRIGGQILAEDIVADADMPPHDHVTMDGHAFAAADGYLLTVVEELFAEDEPPELGSGEAVRIAMDTRLPEHADVVLKREEASVWSGELTGPELDVEMYVYQRGSNVCAGERDHIVRALDELGDVLFHRVALRFGKPITVAELPDAVAVAVPGKPVGVHTIVSLVARAVFTGETAFPTVSVGFARDVDVGAPGVEYAVPVTLSDGEATQLGHADSPLAVYRDTFDSSVLSSSTRALWAYVVVLTELELAAGDEVAVMPYPVVEWS